MKKRWIAIFLFAGAFNASSQVNTDSLANIWKNEKLADTIRLQALQSWKWSLMYQDPDSFFQLASQQLEFSRDRGLRNWEAKALNSIGAYHYLKGNYPLAFSFYQKSLGMFSELGDEGQVSAIYSNIGLILGKQGNNLAALDYYLKALAIDERRKDTASISGTYNNLAIVYQDQQDYPKALEYYEKSLALKQALNADLSMVLNNMGSVYSAMENYPKALECYLKSLEIRLTTGDQTGIAANYQNLGLLYSKQKNFEKSAAYLHKSIALMNELGDPSGIANAWYILGDNSNEQNRHQEAIGWCRKSLGQAQEISALPLERHACYCLYRAYKSLGNTVKALEYHEQFKMLTDSLQRGDLELKLNQMEFAKAVLSDSLAREEEKMQVQLSHQQEMRKKNRTKNAILLFALALLLATLAFLSRMLYFRKSSEQFQLKAEQLEKQKLIGEIALLKTQINPHFLFNSLSILSSLVHIDPELSEKLIDQLSKSYRYILEQRDQSLVTLRTELEFLYSYTFLLKIRFENKFDIIFRIPEQELDRHKIAPLTLQLLIENAVKHNRMSVKEPLQIVVSLEEGMLQVKNQLQPRPSLSPSTGMGLENIKNSYALLTDRPVWAGAEGNDFVVRVPLLN